MELYQHIQARRNAIKAMYEYHLAYKTEKICNTSHINQQLEKISESDRNFVLLTGGMNNVKTIYPVSDQLTTRYTLADLLMAYHLYLKEKNNVGNKADVIAEADRFYMSE